MGKAIGEGAYATVYRAAHRATGRLCAVKRIRLSCLDERGIDNCLKEVGLLRGVNHENIVQYIDSFIDHETRELVIALEWAEAGDLKRQVRRAIRKGGRFDEKIIWKLFTQMAKGTFVIFFWQCNIKVLLFKHFNICITIVSCTEILRFSQPYL